MSYFTGKRTKLLKLILPKLATLIKKAKKMQFTFLFLLLMLLLLLCYLIKIAYQLTKSL